MSEKVQSRLKCGFAMLKHDDVGFRPKRAIKSNDRYICHLLPESIHVGSRRSCEDDSVDAGTTEDGQLAGLALRVLLVGEKDDRGALTCCFEFDLLNAAAEIRVRYLRNDGSNGVRAVATKTSGDVVRLILQKLDGLGNALPNVVADITSAPQAARYCRRRNRCDLGNIKYSRSARRQTTPTIAEHMECEERPRQGAFLIIEVGFPWSPKLPLLAFEVVSQCYEGLV